MSRVRVNLDGPWDFFPDPDRTFECSSLPDTGRVITVPAPWQSQFPDLRDYQGVAWYRRAFDLPDPEIIASPAVAVLRFGAVDYQARVWLNGQFLGEHEGGYLPFEFEINGAASPGERNEVVVEVIDPSADSSAFPGCSFSEIPHGKQSWYGPISGLWQSVFVEWRHETYIAQVKLTPDIRNSRASCEVRLNRPAVRHKQLALRLTHPRGGQQIIEHPFEPGTQVLTCELPTPDPWLWDTQTPHLYGVEAELNDAGDGRLLDRHSTRFGMREISTSPDGHLMLNGRILFLRGALDQDYYPHTIYTPFSDAELDDQFAKAKHMGLNCLRTHIKITDPRYYEAADRAGLLIWAELPNWQDLTEGAKKRAWKTVSGMVERDWNHPSIVIWTIINEGWGLDLAGNAKHRAWLADTYAYLKELDPHRLVVGNSPCFTNFHVVTDIEDFHNYYAIPDHHRQWSEWVRTFSARPPWTFALPYEGIESWRRYSADPWNPTPRTPAPEVRRTGKEPMVVSEFGNWGLPDLQKLRECYGGSEPWWFETGMEWGNGVVYPHGIEERYRVFHLDKVFPTLNDLCAASQRMQYTALKYQIEQIRLQPSIVGYVITEFTDVHWESNGLLDMCRNPKGYYNVIGMVNSADAIVPEWERVAFWSDERCEVRLALSHFSASDIGSTTLKWHLDVQPEIQGQFTGLNPKPAHLLPAGTVAFSVPAVQESVRARLELRLLDESGQLVTRNHLELYFFPRRVSLASSPLVYHPGSGSELESCLEAFGCRRAPALADAQLAVVSTMTDEIRSYVQEGGKVIWLAESTDAQQTYLGTLGLAERQGSTWQGDWASSMNWIRQDQMFASIPTNGTVDFAFVDLTPERVIVGLRPFEFESEVHAGLFVGWIHRAVALVARRRVGDGDLLVSTFRLSRNVGKNPVATIMLRDMIDYLVDGTPRAERGRQNLEPPA